MFDGSEADLRSEAANVCFLRDGLAKLFFKFTGANEDKFFCYLVDSGRLWCKLQPLDELNTNFIR